MNPPFVQTSSRLDRRAFLRAGAVSIGLPLLDAMVPVGWTARARASAVNLSPRRMVLVHRPLGSYHPFLYPASAGPDFEATRFLQKMESHRGSFTLFSGMSHPGYPNSHGTEPAIFTGVSSFNEKDLHNSVSLDQVAAANIGDDTRFRHLPLGSVWSQSLSWNSKGVPTPHEPNVKTMFQRLFVDGTPDEIRREMGRLRDGMSILDQVRGQMHSLARSLGAGDRERLDLLETSIREAEQQLQQEQLWANRPRPVVNARPADFESSQDRSDMRRKWYSLVHLALQTDSSRVIVLSLSEHAGVAEIQHHDASHHGKDPAKIEQLARYEESEFQLLSSFLDKLKASDESGLSLLDKTQVLSVSNLGDASAHSSNNLPVLLAGGGHKHQGHIAFNQENNKPLCNLYVRMLQQLGIEADRFGSSSGVLDIG